MRRALPLTLTLFALVSHQLAVSPARAQIIEVPTFAVGSSGSVFGTAVAIGLDGSLLFVWSQPAGSQERVALSRRFSADGVALAPAQRIDTSGHVWRTAVSAAADGGYVASWQYIIPNGFTATYGQRLNASGAKIGGSFLVGDGALIGGSTAVASLPSGSVFAWVPSNRFFFRLTDLNGIASNDRVEVGSGWIYSDVAARPGGFVVAWWGFESGDNFARLYDVNGAPTTDTLLVSDEFLPVHVAVAPAGDFAVVGIGSQESSQPGAVWYRRFTAEGVAAGAAVPVYPAGSGDWHEPDIEIDVQGNVYIAWGSFNFDTGTHSPPRARAFAADDQPLGPAFDLDAGTGEGMRVARLGNGSFVNTWISPGGVFANVVSLCTPGVAVCGDGTLQPQCEECDDGAANSDTAPDACRTNCQRPRCTDGVADAGEECDDGNLQSCDGCNVQCVSEPGLPCGDGIANPTCGQSCDDSNAIVGDGCDATCRLERVPGGGSAKTDCLVAWQVNNPANVPFLDKKGAISGRQQCVDDDPRCDFDGGIAGACTFLVRVCANNTGMPSCQPGTRLATWELRAPSTAKANKDAGLAAIRAAFNGIVPAAIVGPNATDICSGDVTVTVPLRGHSSAPVAGKLKLADLADLYDGTRDKDSLSLTCLPAPLP